MEFIFGGTTNLEGGKNCQNEVSRELFGDCCVLIYFGNVSNLLLVFLDSLESNTAKMPPEAPCCRLGDGLGQDAKQHGVFGDDVE